MTPQEPESLHSEPSTRDRLLDAAWAEASERGVAALTLAGVGGRAGVTRQAVYLHFANRATLLVAMARHIDETSGFRRRLATTRELPPVEGFGRLLRLWFDYLPTVVDVGLALEAAQLTGGDGADAYRDRMQDWWTGIKLAVDRLDEAGALAPRWTSQRAADWVWTTVHPSVYHHLVSERGWPAEEATAHLVDHLERELIAVPAAATS